MAPGRCRNTMCVVGCAAVPAAQLLPEGCSCRGKSCLLVLIIVLLLLLTLIVCNRLKTVRRAALDANQGTPSARCVNGQTRAHIQAYERHSTIPPAPPAVRH